MFSITLCLPRCLTTISGAWSRSVMIIQNIPTPSLYVSGVYGVSTLRSSFLGLLFTDILVLRLWRLRPTETLTLLLWGLRFCISREYGLPQIGGSVFEYYDLPTPWLSVLGDYSLTIPSLYTSRPAALSTRYPIFTFLTLHL